MDCAVIFVSVWEGNWDIGYASLCESGVLATGIGLFIWCWFVDKSKNRLVRFGQCVLISTVPRSRRALLEVCMYMDLVKQTVWLFA